MDKEKMRKLSGELAKSLIGAHLLEMRLSVLMNDIDVKGRLKKMFNNWKRMISRIKTEFKIELPEEYEVIEQELFNDEVSLQVESITTLLLSIPKVKRDEVEEWLEQEYITFKNKI